MAMEQLGQVKMAKGDKKEGEKYIEDSKKILKEMGA
jgi:hypothetical protein